MTIRESLEKYIGKEITIKGTYQRKRKLYKPRNSEVEYDIRTGLISPIVICQSNYPTLPIKVINNETVIKNIVGIDGFMVAEDHLIIQEDLEQQIRGLKPKDRLLLVGVVYNYCYSSGKYNYGLEVRYAKKMEN